MRPLVIVGAGGHGREVLDIVAAVNAVEPTWEFQGFLDSLGGAGVVSERRGAPVLGPIDELASVDAEYVIGLGAPSMRREVDALASAAGRTPATLVHPTATVGSDVSLGPGAVVAAGARITTNVTTGRHVHLNLNSTVSHDCTLADYVTLSPGASVAGNVRLGCEVNIGMGAVVIQRVTIGDRAVVGAGAVVIRDVPSDVTVVGAPAHPLSER